MHRDNPVQGLTARPARRGLLARRSSWQPRRPGPDLGRSRHQRSDGRPADRLLYPQRRPPARRSSSKKWCCSAASSTRAALRQEDNLEMVKNIAKTPNAIGFAGATYELPRTKAVPIAAASRGEFFAIDLPPEPDRVLSARAPDAARGQPRCRRPSSIRSKRSSSSTSSAAWARKTSSKAGFTPVSSKPAQIALDSVDLKADRVTRCSSNKSEASPFIPSNARPDVRGVRDRTHRKESFMNPSVWGAAVLALSCRNRASPSIPQRPASSQYPVGRPGLDVGDVLQPGP